MIAALRRRTSALLANGQFWRFALTFGPTMAALGLQFAAFALTARGLGVSMFGRYAAIQGIASICVELVGLGGADLLVRSVARDTTQFSRYFGNMLNLIWVTLVPVLLIAWFCTGRYAGSGLSPLSILTALFAEILVGRVSSSIELTMVAHRHVLRASLVRMATPMARLAAAIIYFHSHSTLEGWILVVLAQALLMSAALVAVAIAIYGRPSRIVLFNEWRTGTAFAINQFSRAAQGNLDRVVLAYFADAIALGVYAAGSRVLQLGLFPLQIMTRILYPQFFVHGEKGIAASRRFGIASLPAMLGTGVFAAAMAAGAGLFAPFLLGHDFARSSHTTILLALSLPLIALQYLAADILTGAGYQHIRAVIYGLTAVLFGFALAAGARLGGTDGMIAAYLIIHVVLAAVLWVTAFTVGPRKAG
jgi:O-antigen/teichoic acid export membrane protein